jgi:large subunit ribosomal protein L10
MPTAKKVQQVEELRDRLGRATIAISADYRGLSVGQAQALRRRLRESGVELRVVKNTLLRIAAREADREDMLQIIEGPTAIAFGFESDIVAPAKAITEYIRQSRSTLTVKGAYAEGRVLSADDINDLASAPSRPELLGRIAGGLQSPVANLVGLLSATVRDLAGLVDARVTQLEATESA